jgi:hypothetical protein
MKSLAYRGELRPLVCDHAGVSIDDALQPLLDEAAVTGSLAEPDDLIRLWRLVGLDDPLRLDEFLETIAPDAGDGLALRVGPWHIDLAATAVRTSVLTALVAGVLIPHGLGDFAVGFVTAVLPSVVEIDRVELGAGDRKLLVELRAKRNLGSEDELYAALPAKVRAQINRYDFADFIARLRDLGLAKGPDDGTIELSAR